MPVSFAARLPEKRLLPLSVLSVCIVDNLRADLAPSSILLGPDFSAFLAVKAPAPVCEGFNYGKLIDFDKDILAAAGIFEFRSAVPIIFT